MNTEKFSDLIGKTLISISGDKGDDRMIFTTDAGEEYLMHHIPDCCETVQIEDICGSLGDLIGSPILQAEESSNDQDPEGYDPGDSYRESFTWTFYRIATRRGGVVIRWLGESNGYYSERVDFIRTK